MMQDPLKQYIEDNRSAFDEATPGERVWETIERRLARTPEIPAWTLRHFGGRLAIAAALLGAVSITLFYFFRPDKHPGSVSPLQANTTIPQKDQNQNGGDTLYSEELYHVAAIIQIKFREMEKIKTDHPELYERFSGDLKNLDNTYQQLKQRLPNEPDQEMLLQAMLQNLMLQVDLINRQLGIIQQIKKDSHEKKSSRL
jgi:hypothetical protein